MMDAGLSQILASYKNIIIRVGSMPHATPPILWQCGLWTILCLRIGFQSLRHAFLCVQPVSAIAAESWCYFLYIRCRFVANLSVIRIIINMALVGWVVFLSSKGRVVGSMPHLLASVNGACVLVNGHWVNLAEQRMAARWFCPIAIL